MLVIIHRVVIIHCVITMTCSTLFPPFRQTGDLSWVVCTQTDRDCQKRSVAALEAFLLFVSFVYEHVETDGCCMEGTWTDLLGEFHAYIPNRKPSRCILISAYLSAFSSPSRSNEQRTSRFRWQEFDVPVSLTCA